MKLEFNCMSCNGSGRVADQRCETCSGIGVTSLTMRDVFATFALQGLLGTTQYTVSGGDNQKQVLALGAYQLADEMMKARRV